MLSRRTLMQAFFALPFASLFVKKAEAKEVSQVPPLTTPEYARKFFDDHVPTGIPELDNALGGGFPKGKVTSVTCDYRMATDIFMKTDVVLFGGEYGESYISAPATSSIKGLKGEVYPQIFYTIPDTPEVIYKACDAALKEGKAVVFTTSRKPMIEQKRHNRLPDVYVVFDSITPTPTNCVATMDKGKLSFSVVTVNKQF